MKLHLGCGQRYFEGYVNIDYPLSEHSVQEKSVADELADITKLKYAPGTVDEVRLHHVFEHFSRPMAAALLTNWHQWLKAGGRVHIEVPDFEKTGKAALGMFTSEKLKYVALRHIFGSQEAHWAVHYEGYSESVLKKLLQNFGYVVKEVKRNDWKGTYNIEIIAEKSGSISAEQALVRAKEHFRLYLLDETESELRLLDTWIHDFKSKLIL